MGLVMNAVIIEDEIQAVVALQSELEKAFKQINIVATAATVNEAVKVIEANQPELVFLDIQLKDGTGFDVLKQVNYNHLKIIFTTAYSEFALQAIKVSALDYLLKPIDTDELKIAVNKAIEQDNKQSQLKIENFIANQGLNPLQKKVTIATSKGIDLIEAKSIIRLQSEGNYSALYLTTGKKILVAKVLKDFEFTLTNLGFVRIHNSHIINLHHLENYNNKDGGFVVLTDKTTLPVSKRKKGAFLALLNKNI